MLHIHEYTAEVLRRVEDESASSLEGRRAQVGAPPDANVIAAFERTRRRLHALEASWVDPRRASLLERLRGRLSGRGVLKTPPREGQTPPG